MLVAYLQKSDFETLAALTAVQQYIINIITVCYKF